MASVRGILNIQSLNELTYEKYEADTAVYEGSGALLCMAMGTWLL